MKTLKTILAGAMIAIGATAMAQSVVMEENFSSFKEQGWRAGSDTLACGKKKVDSKSNFKVTKVYGSEKITFGFKHAAVTPECGAKKTPSAVSNGYVEINKKEGSELTVGPFKEVTTVEVGASATGDVRGYALYKSIDGGAFTKVGEYIGAKSEGQDAQYGFNSVATINSKNVTLKFVPTICGKDEPAMQTFRIHNIKVNK